MIGLDSVRVHSNYDRIKIVLAQHYARLQRNRMYAQSRLVFIPENNLANEATTMCHMLKELNINVQVYYDRAETLKPGIRKDASTIGNYRLTIINKMTSNDVRFSSDGFSSSGDASFSGMRVFLMEQMHRFHIETKITPGFVTRERVKMTGKSGSNQDDLAIAFMQCVYYGRRDRARRLRTPHSFM